MLEFETLPQTCDKYGKYQVIRRAPIRGGWLVTIQSHRHDTPLPPSETGPLPAAITFVPDPDHRWDGSSIRPNRTPLTTPDHLPPETPVDLILLDRGDNMIPVIKRVRHYTGWSLLRSREAMDQLPLAILVQQPYSAVREVEIELQSAGARTRVRFPAP